MESIEFFQVFIIIIILIMTLLYIYFRSLTSSVAAFDTDIPPLREKYDVFISFRGEDTRNLFTSHLHKALLGKKIETYIDYRLEKGDDIGPALLEAIGKSKIALVIFSKDYASSTWCMKELVHILGCKKSHRQIVIPIFYHIDPSHVRKQKGTYAIGGLLWRLKKRFKVSMDEVANWRAALEVAANISGFHDSSKTGTDADLVEEVVQDVLTKLNRESSSDLKGLVGIQRKIEEIESLLCLDSPGVCCVGIWGMGGIGKTTLADAVFHKLSSKFDAACFLANVREKSEQTGGLNQLRNELVREILKDRDTNIGTLSIGPTSIRDRLSRTKAFIVIDDVNDPRQLEFLVGYHDQFCDGSRIIITARDKGTKVLIDMSLISISKRNSIEMHDLVQEMGRAIVREQCIEERSRLFSAEDVYDVLTNNKEAARVQAVFFEELNLNHADFRKIYKLRLLIAETYDFGCDILENFSLHLPNSLSYLDWVGYPLSSLPSNFSPENLLVLHMPFSKVGAQLWNEGQSPVNLKEIDLSYCRHLSEVPNLSRSLKIERIDLVGCEGLIEIPLYFQHLHKLTYLRLAGCQNIKYLPAMPCNVEFNDFSHTAMMSEMRRHAMLLPTIVRQLYFTRNLRPTLVTDWRKLTTLDVPLEKQARNQKLQ